MPSALCSPLSEGRNVYLQRRLVVIQPARHELFLLLQRLAHFSAIHMTQTHLVLLRADKEVLAGGAPLELHELVKLQDPPLAAQVSF